METFQTFLFQIQFRFFWNQLSIDTHETLKKYSSPERYIKIYFYQETISGSTEWRTQHSGRRNFNTFSWYSAIEKMTFRGSTRISFHYSFLFANGNRWVLIGDYFHKKRAVFPFLSLVSLHSRCIPPPPQKTQGDKSFYFVRRFTVCIHMYTCSLPRNTGSVSSVCIM